MIYMSISTVWLCLILSWIVIEFLFFGWYMRKVGMTSNAEVPLKVLIVGGPIVWAIRIYVRYKNRNI